MSVLKVDNKKIIFQKRDEIVCIEAYGTDCIRVRASRNAILSNEKWTLLPAEEDNAEIQSEEESCTIKNNILSAEIHKTFDGYVLTFLKMVKKF